MLPPSLTSKLPSQGGALNNEARDGMVGSDRAAEGISIGGSSFSSIAVNVSGTTVIAPRNGIDNDVVMSDAFLLYIDDVEREFEGRPRVCNEFLAIMKNFESQEVDTPGVIARVSRLFRGKNHLLLGFNNFLSDGYKISMEDLKQIDAAYAREQELLRQQQTVMLDRGRQHQQQRQQQQAEAQIPLPQQRVAAEQQRPLQQQQGIQPPRNGIDNDVVMSDAVLLYLDDVAREFEGRPGIYDEFLAIMKYFERQEDTPGVIARLSHLFQGKNHLILGFNKLFLPDGYKISMEDLKQIDAAYAREH